MDVLREYKVRKRQLDFLRRQQDAMHSNYPLVRDHIHIPGWNPLLPSTSLGTDKQKRAGSKSTSALCASVANTAVILTAGSLELDHNLRLKLHPEDIQDDPSSAFSTVSSRGGDKKAIDAGPETRRKSRSPLPTVDIRRRAASAAAPREKAVTLRAHFVLTPLSKRTKTDVQNPSNTRL